MLTTFCSTPLISCPKTTAIFLPFGGVNLFSEMLFSACSIEHMINPSFFKACIDSLVDSKYFQHTDSVAPRAVLFISLCGGVAVIPHKWSSCTLKASAVLNIEPMLLRLLILSRTITMGVFFVDLNSSTESRLSSSFFNFLIFQQSADIFQQS